MDIIALVAAVASRRMLAAFVACCIAVPSGGVFAQNAQPPAGGFSALQGFIIDSIHGVPLANANVIIQGTKRAAVTNADGHYRIDSIPPGNHRVLVLHPLLDTLGVTMETPDYPFAAGQARDLDVPIPSPRRIAMALCTAAMQIRGPAVMLGFVRDPDNMAPAIGSRVSLVYNQPDILGHKQPSVKRESPVDSSGMYKICGLPANMSGTVQVFRNGVSSGEVPIEMTNGFVALRAFSVAGTQATVEVKGDSGKVKRVATGTAQVTGKVVDKRGQPLRDARVTLQSGGRVALTRANGTFVLDSLPSGTQAIQVRKLGYAVTEVPVELAAGATATTTVTMGDAVPVLATVRVEATEDKALSDIGYLRRKQTGMGFYMDGKMINHEALTFSDVMRVAPGLRISPAGDGRTYVITDSRNAANGCVNFYVDNVLWTQMTPGDIDEFVRPSELVAVEVYHGSETPPEYQPPGQSGCATIVAWTQAKVNTLTKRKTP